MNDIHWRDLDTNFAVYDKRNASRQILCKDVAGNAWITTCQHVSGYQDQDSGRFIYFYAFI